MTDMDLLLALRSHARHRPERLAIEFEDQRRTYRGLAERVSLLVGAFRARGCQVGHRVGIAVYSGTLPLELYLAAQAAGLEPVMLSWTLGPALTEVAAALQVRHLFAGAQAIGLSGLEHAVAPARVWSVEVEGSADDVGGFVASDVEPDDMWIPARDPEQVSGIQFSAGSTGRPKAVLRSVRADVWDGWQKMLAFRGNDADQWLCITPMNLGVLVGAFRPMLLFGGALIVLPQFSADATVAAIEHGATIVPLQTPHWFELLRHPKADRLGARGLRTLVATGQRTPVGLAARVREMFPGAHFVVNYGTTESSTVAVLSGTDPAFGTQSCVGKPLPTIQVEVVDRQHQPVATGDRGEIRLRGPSVVPGYESSVGEPRQTMRDGWFSTGDVGEWDPQGNLYVIDRWADVFEAGGQQVYPGEVQEELFRLDGIVDAAVAGVTGAGNDSVTPTAFVVPRDGVLEVDSAAIRLAIRRVTAAPFTVRSVSRLPKTLGGKLDRAALKRGVWE
jgi:acyl-CoA synthetase (AMP-forming)/AMP-acid ligase II